MRSLFLSTALLLPALVASQLSGTVGPLTSRAAKAAIKVCNILDYGGVASATTDNSAAILDAWAACIDGGEIYIPSGSYGLSTWITLNGGNANSINLEGTIYRIGTAGGNMIYIELCTDFEFYSGNSKGAIQGYGYVFASAGTYGPKILRLYEVTNFSVHDFVLVDSPQYHLTLDTCTNGEIYNMVVRGGNEGGLDGFDVLGENIWVHDVEVTNKDECVTVKSPASNIMVENVFCNWSGGCAIGSLGADTDIYNIEYNHIYSQNCNQNTSANFGPDVHDQEQWRQRFPLQCPVEHFMGHTNAYTLDLNAYWSSEAVAAGNGVQYYDITFNHWHGTCTNGATRAPIQLFCPALVPCYNITVENFYIWTEMGSVEYYKCENAYGSGPCLKTGSDYTTYTSTGTVTTASSYAITSMSGELTSGLGITASIAIPTIPASFFPSIKPYSTLLG